MHRSKWYSALPAGGPRLAHSGRAVTPSFDGFHLLAQVPVSRKPRSGWCQGPVQAGPSAPLAPGLSGSLGPQALPSAVLQGESAASLILQLHRAPSMFPVLLGLVRRTVSEVLEATAPGPGAGPRHSGLGRETQEGCSTCRRGANACLGMTGSRVRCLDADVVSRVFRV